MDNLSATNMVSEFTSTIMGVMSRFIPNKIITCNDKDPPWITPVYVLPIHIDRYHYYLSVVKFFRKLFLIPCIDILLTINS